MDLPDRLSGQGNANRYAATTQTRTAPIGAVSFGPVTDFSNLGPAQAGTMSGSPTWRMLPARRMGPSSRRFPADTLCLVAVYFVAVVAALMTPPAEAVGLEEDDRPTTALTRRIERAVPLRGGHTAQSSALPFPTISVLAVSQPMTRREAAVAVVNQVPDPVLSAAVAEYEGAEQALRPGGLAELLDETRKSPRDDAAAGDPLLLGMYTSASLQVSAPELDQIDGWLADNGLSSRITIAGTFMDFEFPNPEWNIAHDLEAAWRQGDIPFVNLAVGTTDLGPRSAADVAQGVTDDSIRTWARLFAEWTEGGNKWAYIAPLQEMNGGWVTYGLDPVSFKQAYLRVQRIFTEEGVPGESVVWVFAPNGWSESGHEFELYYPGDELVDVVAFSAFNFGACSCYAKTWDTFEGAFRPYLQRMREMAPGKPIFVAQTGTVSQGGDKDAWLLDTLTGLDEFEGVEAIIYFNVAKPEAGGAACPIVDWRLFDPNSGHGQQGFLAAIERMEYRGRGNPSGRSSSAMADGGADTAEEERHPGKAKKPKDTPDRDGKDALPPKAHAQDESGF